MSRYPKQEISSQLHFIMPVQHTNMIRRFLQMRLFVGSLIIGFLLGIGNFTPQGTLLAQPTPSYSIKNKRAIKWYEQARFQFRLRDSAQAFQLLAKALKKEPRFVEAYLLQAQIYDAYNQPQQALEAHLQAFAVDSLAFLPAYFHAARQAHSIGQYQQAYELLMTYKQLDTLKKIHPKKVQFLLSHIEYARYAYNHPHSIDPIPLPAAINSEYDEYFPILSHDALTLSFTRLLPNPPPSPTHHLLPLQEDLYYSQRTFEESPWQEAVPYPAPIKSPMNEGAQTTIAREQVRYFTRCQGPCQLWESHQNQEGTWSTPQPLPAPINSPHVSTKQPSITPDGRFLFFASDRPGGLGHYDIWVAEYLGEGQWDNPQNLGPTINTPFEEQTPFIHHDGQTLYFASQGHPGMGALDLFLTRKDAQGEWSTPQNLGYPINTHHVEMGLSVSPQGDVAFMASERENKNLDIYAYPLPPALRPTPVSYVTLTIQDHITREPLPAQYQLLALDSGNTPMQGQAPTNGTVALSLPAGKQYALFVQHPHYLPHSHHFALEETTPTQPNDTQVSTPQRILILLAKPEPQQEVTLANTFFPSDSFTLSPESLYELQRWVTLLKQHPDWIVRLEGHTDSTGAPQHNLTLSDKRAQAVQQFLIQAGVPSRQVQAKGYGDTHPIATNLTPQGRAQNRRTTLRILSLESNATPSKNQ